MRTVEKQIIDLLNSIVNSSLVKFNHLEDIDWRKIREISMKHNIEGLVYSSIKYNCIDGLDDKLIDKWKKATFSTGIAMNQFIKFTCRIFCLFQEKNIDFIVLKGIYLRYLYPNPDLRTMSDIDILVHKEDLDKISEILLDLEYQKIGENSYHVEYLSKNNHCIEIHWKLEKDVLDKGENYFGDEIWNNAIEINVGDVISKTLGLEDQIIYLLFHMASHLVYSGFGLRQLCDFALLVKHKENEVNWNKVKIDIEKVNLNIFAEKIFIICNKVFNINIPKELEYDSYMDEKELDIFIEYIFSMGVYGDREVSGIYSKNIVNEIKNSNKFIAVFKMLFPTVDNLSIRYNYAKKNKILLPIVWIHRLFYILSKVFKSDSKGIIKNIFQGSNQREYVLNKLGL